ncbi:MAG: HAD hydrolase family protein, partial [Patescibacteria group bacterium]
ILFDIDGSVLPQGDKMNPKVAEVMRLLRLEFGIKLGPATGKNYEYARGVGIGAGLHWDFIVAETGAQIAELLSPGPPPQWRRIEPPNVPTEDLALFAQIIGFDPLNGLFRLRRKTTEFRNELKNAVLSMFPRDPASPATTVEWQEHFQQVIAAHDLRLVVHRFDDGCNDIVPKGITKWLGVEAICQLLDCESEDILTVVDYSNDHELVQGPGRRGTTPIAVHNASDEIKKIVSVQPDYYLASRNDGFGFCEGLIHFAQEGRLPAELEPAILKILPDVAPPASNDNVISIKT